MSSRRAAQSAKRARRRQAHVPRWGALPALTVTVGHGHDLDCGCERLGTLTFASDLACPACGRVSQMLAQSVQMPTSEPVGTLRPIVWGCPCGAEVEVIAEVVA